MSALLDEMAMAISRSYAWTQDDFDGVARAAAAVVAARLRDAMETPFGHLDIAVKKLNALLAELESGGER